MFHNLYEVFSMLRFRPAFRALSVNSAVALSALLLGGNAHAFEVSSPSFQPGQMLAAGQVFQGFGCEGGNRSPALNWTTPPAGTQSLAITVYDPDAPTGSGWWHWVAYNLPANLRSLPEGAGQAGGANLPTGAVQVRNDFGVAAYGGACPPAGDAPHRYIFTVHALKTPRLDLPPDASPALVGYMLGVNRLASATVQARYGR